MLRVRFGRLTAERSIGTTMKRDRRPPAARAATPEIADLERASRVRLRPFLGMSPGTYLTGIYALILLLALFLVLLYPGLRAPGGRIAVTATPRNVTVWLDGRFVGTTPLSVKAGPGTHDLELTRAGFAAARLQVELAPRAIGTLIVRNRASAHADLELTDAAGVARRSVAEFGGASHVTGIIEDAGRALARAEPSAQYAFLRDVVPFVDRRQALGALVRAAATSAAGGGPVTPQAARSMFDRLLQLDRDYPGLPLWLAAAAPNELRERLAAQPWYHESGARYRSAVTSHPVPRPTAPREAVVVGGIRFRPIPGGTLLMGDDVDRPLRADAAHDHQPHLRAVAPFLMAETEVTNRQFARFVADVPLWSPRATAGLVSEGLAEPSYLASWSEGVPVPGTLDQPVTHVSHHAAAAFAAWLGTAASAGGAWPYGDMIVRLPTEAEWEWAARGGMSGQPYPNGTGTGGARLAGTRVGGTRVPGPGAVPASQPNAYGLHDLLGNVWEWTATWYAPASYLLWTGDEPVQPFAGQPRAGAERVVRGGSWASERDLIRVHSRGAQEPAWATPYLGFRVVIALPDAPDG